MNKQNFHPSTRRYLRLLLAWDLLVFVVVAMVFVTISYSEWVKTIGISHTVVEGIRIAGILIMLPWGLIKIFDLRGYLKWLDASLQLDEEKRRSNGGEKP